MTWSIGAGLEGKGVIVTGATGGIGKAIVEAFATTGAKVLAVDLDQSKVDDVVSGLEGSGHIGMAANVGEYATHQAMVDRAIAELRQLLLPHQRRRRAAPQGQPGRGDRGGLGLPARHQPQGGVLPGAHGRQRDDRPGQGRPDHPVQLPGLVDGRLRRVGGVCRDQGRRDLDVPRARAHVRAAPHHRQLRLARARSTRPCSSRASRRRSTRT